MPNITSTIYGFGNILSSTAHFENWGITGSATLYSLDDSAVYVSHGFFDININGNVVGATYGIEVIGHEVTISNSGGVIQSNSSNHLHAAIHIGSGFFSSSPDISNSSGSVIRADKAVGIYMSQANGEIYNEGLITGGTGIRLTGSASDTFITNGDTIVAMGNESAGSDTTYGHGIYSGGQNTVIHNLAANSYFDEDDGLIRAIGGGAAIMFDTYAQGSGVYNEADIISNSGIGINAYGIYGPQGVAIINTSTGLIAGATTAILGSKYDDIILGQGQFVGDIRSSFGDDNINLTGALHYEDIFGGGGNDTIIGARNTATIYGGSGNDTITGGSQNDRIYGGTGDDVINSGRNTDIILGGDGDDTIYSGANTGTIYGGDGDDYITNASWRGKASGGDGDDIIIGSSGSTGDLLYGDADNDSLKGNAGDDTIYGGTGNDSVLGGTDNDLLNGGDGNDVIFGNRGDDTLYGDDGDDSLFGGDGDDGVVGGDGDDFIRGGDGADFLLAGDGNDVIEGQDGNDTISGAEGNDTLLGGDGNDRLYGGFGADSVNGGDGNDILDSSYGGSDGLSDILIGGKGGDVINGGDGDDDIRAGADKDQVDGGDGDDRIHGGFAADDLTGGNGADTFVYLREADSDLSNVDTIQDFTSGTDLFDLQNLSLSTFVGTTGFSGSGVGEVGYVVSTGGNAMLEIDTDGDGKQDMEIYLLGVTALDVADFIL